MEREGVTRTRLIGSVILTLCCMFLLMLPRTVKADDTGNITNYSELVKMTSDGYYSINPDTDFGWPSEKVIVELRGSVVTLMDNWTIPANVTINTPEQISGSWGGNNCTITVEGIWNQNGTGFHNENFVIKKGGSVVVNKDCVMVGSYDSTANSMTVENGGKLVLNDWLVITGTLNLKSDASVVCGAESKKGGIKLCHGTIYGDEATIEASVELNGNYTSGDGVPTGAAVLMGDIHLNDLRMSSGEDLNITGKVTVDSFSAGYELKDKVVVKKGATLTMLADLYENAYIVVDAGGTIRGPESPKGTFILEGAKMVLNGTFEVPWYLKVLTTKSTITGTGTIDLGKEGSLINGRDGIADTIKLTGTMANKYSNNSSTGFTIKNGSTIAVAGANYKVVSTTKKTLQYTKPVTSKATMTIPATVTISGTTYEVTSIAANAFKNNTKVTKITIGKNVTSIGKNAFYGCKKLKTATVGAAVTTIGANAFYKCSALTSVTIPAKVTSIGAKAFSGDKKLKTITIKTTKLTDKKVGSQAFKGIYSKATIKTPKNKVTAYKKLLKKKGVTSKAKFKKI